MENTSGVDGGEHKLNPNPLDLMGNVWRSISCGQKCVCERLFRVNSSERAVRPERWVHVM